jgi:[NiFe] hydrogenase diaphorase moiety large subunit
MSDCDQTVTEICQKYGNDKTRMLDIARDVQAAFGCVSKDAQECVAKCVGSHRVEVEGVVSFYSFLSSEPKGAIVIRLSNDIIDLMHGAERVAEAFKVALGIDFGETTPDGKISLEWTPCIGMCDQAPAALVNDVVVTYLSTDKAREIVDVLKRTGDPKELVQRLGDGNNANPLVQSMVYNGVRKKAEMIFGEMENGAAIRNATSMSPVEVINAVKNARLRGRGGAGFPTGIKWEFTRAAAGDDKYIMCNADEGEPGTFKDRVLLTEKPDLMLEGMSIAGYAIGAKTGIIYLRGEYAYLQSFLEEAIRRRRERGLLGQNILGKEGFDFDVRIQMGAGAYVCGEETALISSCEGVRGDPKDRPPFPAQKGYLARPTCVNNVETFCKVSRILEMGAGWFAQVGVTGSPGTKLLSIAGDCSSPGVYEFPFGVRISEVLAAAGAEDAFAVQMGGPSGRLVGRNSTKPSPTTMCPPGARSWSSTKAAIRCGSSSNSSSSSSMNPAVTVPLAGSETSSSRRRLPRS